MRLNTLLILLVAVVALATAAPQLSEKKSLEDSTIDKEADLRADGGEGEKDRSKKSATRFCVQINSGSDQATQSSCKEQPQLVQPAPQTIQTLNLVQPPVYIPQPVAQPCAQPQTIVVPRPVPEVAPPAPAPEPAPEPQPTPAPEEPKPAPIIVEPAQPLPEPQETLNVLPVATLCEEQVYSVPASPVVLVPEREQLATVVELPVHQCNHQQLVAPCNCQRNAVMRSGIDMESLKDVEALLKTHREHNGRLLYPPTPLFSVLPSAPCNSRMMGPVAARMAGQPDNMENFADGQIKSVGPQGRTSTIIKVNAAKPSHPVLHHHHYKTIEVPVNSYPSAYPVRGYVSGVPAPSGITINAYPHVNAGSVGPFYRQASPEDNQSSLKWSEGSLANPEPAKFDSGAEKKREIEAEPSAQ